MDLYTFTKSYLDNCKKAELDQIADESGVPYHTILKIKSGETKNPGVLTIQKLYAVITKNNPELGQERRSSPGRRAADRGRRSSGGNDGR